MIAPSIQSHNSSPFCSSNYNKSATIRHHPHHHQSKAATRSKIRPSTIDRALAKHENQRSFKYTRTLDIIQEEQQQDTSRRSGGYNHYNNDELQNNNNNNNAITTDFWHSTQSMKKSATNSVSLESLMSSANEGETNTGENQTPIPSTALGQIVIPNIVFDDDFENFLEDWEL